MTRTQPECWLTDSESDGPQALVEAWRRSGRRDVGSAISIRSAMAVQQLRCAEELETELDELGDSDGRVPICHGAPYHGRKHEPVRMDSVENRDWFRCGQCGSRASVGEKHD